VRVGIAEDSALFREGLEMQLGRLGLQITISAHTGEELLERAARDPVDAAILDVRMPPTFTDEGLRTAEQLAQRHPGTGILVLSAYAELAYATRLFAAGTGHRGYLLKDRVDNAAALRDALERVRRGESVVDDALIARLLDRQRHLSRLDNLTEREGLVLQHMAEGRSNAGIAGLMQLAEKTIESYVARIFVKLGLTGSQETNRRVLAVLAWLRSSELPGLTRPGGGGAGARGAGGTAGTPGGRGRPPASMR
jgi:DNA-binding NarL/FixJ family response regulator